MDRGRLSVFVGYTFWPKGNNPEPARANGAASAEGEALAGGARRQAWARAVLKQPGFRQTRPDGARTRPGRRRRVSKAGRVRDVDARGGWLMTQRAERR
jgi:hypothetical protein